MYEELASKRNLLENVLLYARYAIEEEDGENPTSHSKATCEGRTGHSLVARGSRPRPLEGFVFRSKGLLSGKASGREAIDVARDLIPAGKFVQRGANLQL